MKRLKKSLLIPLLLALLPAIVIVMLLPPMFERYELIAEEQHLKQKDNAYIRYYDTDNDGTNEKIQGIDSEIGTAAILIYQHDGELLGQYNYPGKFPFRNHINIWTDDYDDDSIAEIYFFTQRQDSAFMQIMSVKDKYEPVFEREVFIDTIRSTKDGLHDFGAFIHEFRDVNKDGKKEVLFTVRGYYSILPRKTGVYDVANDQLKYSQNFAAKPGISFLEFSSGKPVFLVVANSSANIDDPNPYYGSDLKDQLFLLDEDMNLLKGPVEYGKYHSSKYNKMIPEKQNIFTINIADKAENNNSRIYARIFDYQLNLVKENSLLLPITSKSPIRLECGNNLAYGTKQNLFVIDHETLQLTRTLEFDFPIGRKIAFLNLDKDPQREIAGINSSHIYVIDDDMKTITATPVSFSIDNKTYIDKIPGKENQNRFLVQNQEKYHIYSYHENDAYIFQYPFYLLIYILSAAFTYGVTVLTRRNTEKKHRLEREMLNLQLQSTRNQASPHFTFNLLNTISAAILNEDKEKAQNMVSSMGQLMRSSLEHSEKVERSLDEELGFVENYLQLEKQRYNHKLDYKIEIDPEVNTSLPMPKMLLQIFAENAVKHGISRLKTKSGLIKIQITKTSKAVSIKVEDNGVGRHHARQNNQPTTKSGLKIADKIIALHKKLNGYDINYEIKDLFDEQNNAKGTKILITIPL